MNRRVDSAVWRWWQVALCAAGALLLIQWEHLDQPPVWDTAMGLFPPAIWLARHGFDVATLVDLPAWSEGGPNVYSLSLVTWVSAGVLTVAAPHEVHLQVLHLLHLGLAAMTIGGVFRLARPILGHGLAVLAALMTLLLPVYAAQATQLYLEIPLAACTVTALFAAVQRRWVAAGAWVWVAVAVKPTALVVAAVVVTAAALDRGTPGSQATMPRRLTRAIGICIGPIVVLFVNLWASSKKGVNPWSFSYFDYLVDCVNRLRATPDILAMLAFTVAGSLLTFPRHMGALLARPAVETDLCARAAALCCLTVLAWVGFVLCVPLGGAVQPLLPRHIVAVAGPMLVCGMWLGARVLPHRFIVAAALVLCAFFALNSHGRFYPKESRSFAVAERSLAYRDFLRVQRGVIAAVDRLPPQLHVFYPLPDHYFLSDPLLGYASSPREGGRCVRFESPWRHGRLADYPSRFVVALSNAYHGGEALRRVVEQAQSDPAWSAREVAHFSAGDYGAKLVEVWRAQVRVE